MSKRRKDGMLARIAVSACLAGEVVRYDGGQKSVEFIEKMLPQWFDLVLVCPEVAVGLGVPRPPVHLVRKASVIDAVGIDSPELSVGALLSGYGRQMVGELNDIDGYVFKARSPSCSVRGIAVQGGKENERHAGLFAHCFMQAYPLMPLVEEGALISRAGRLRFFDQVIAYRDWRCLLAQEHSWEQLRAFHCGNHFRRLAHGVSGARALEHWFEEAFVSRGCINDAYVEYGQRFMAHVAHRATPKRHVAALRQALQLRQADVAERTYLALSLALDEYSAGFGTLASLKSEMSPIWCSSSAKICSEAYFGLIHAEEVL